jgi:tetraacyldisaccharide 4'-kinase
MLPQASVFSTSHVPYFYQVPRNTGSSPAELSALAIHDCLEAVARQRAVAFSGIARNDDFRQTLDALEINVTQFSQFPDHHWYSESDFAALNRAVEKTSAQYLVTTEKDYARIAHRLTWPLELIVVGVRISLGADEERFEAFLKKRLSSRKSGLWDIK